MCLGTAANSALWRIALVRMHCHQPTKDYVARRTAEGRTKKEILRCLKRYISPAKRIRCCWLRQAEHCWC
jgi:hypothetical protein